MIKKGVGKSKGKDPFNVGSEAAEVALNDAGITECDLVIVSATDGFEDYTVLLEGIREKTGDAPLIGSLAGGVITQDGPDEDLRSVAVMVIKSDQIKFTPVLAEGLKDDSKAVGKEIASKLAENWPEKPKFILMFPGGLTVNTDGFFKGLEDGLPEKIPFVGGTSGGTVDFKKTYQFFNDRVLTDSAPCVLFSGDMMFETAVSHGAQSSGMKNVITKAEGNILYEFNNKPAVELYKEYLGSDVDELDLLAQSSVCLGTKVPKEFGDKYEDVILRIPLAIQKDGSFIMTAEWKEGTEVFVCMRDHKRIIEKALKRAEEIKTKIKDKGSEPELILHFNCLGRGKVIMGRDVSKEEVEVSQKIISKDIPWLGWYTYGEIAPVGDKNEFHNWSSVYLAIYL